MMEKEKAMQINHDCKHSLAYWLCNINSNFKDYSVEKKKTEFLTNEMCAYLY